jgi:CrcB protein
LQPTAALWVFLGALFGTALRLVLEALLPYDGVHWPWATLFVNLSGAFVLGALLEGLVRSGDHSELRQRIRLSCGTGGCGAFTTYSTLALEISLLSKNAQVATAVGYGAASVVGGVVAAWLGIICSAGVHGRRSRA